MHVLGKEIFIFVKQKENHCGWGAETRGRQEWKKISSERKVRVRPSRVDQSMYLDIYSKVNRQNNNNNK